MEFTHLHACAAKEWLVPNVVLPPYFAETKLMAAAFPKENHPWQIGANHNVLLAKGPH
jgi:hypothetical protein